jgi:hypothetical protein
MNVIHFARRASGVAAAVLSILMANAVAGATYTARTLQNQLQAGESATALAAATTPAGVEIVDNGRSRTASSTTGRLSFRRRRQIEP